MRLSETTLPGAYVVEWEPHTDERGFFARTFCQREFAVIREGITFVQANVSHNRSAGTTRGMHFQYPPAAEAKLIACVAGAVVDVIVDIRRGSATFLEHIAVELTATNDRMLFVPEGFAHGFQTLVPDTRLMYHHTEFYEPGSEGGLRYSDPRLGIAWPHAEVTISDKDAAYPLIDGSFAGIALEGV